jgi:hypothetical protein
VRALRRPLVAVVLVAAAAVAARVAFGQTHRVHASSGLPACAGAGRAVRLPAALRRFPLPAGTVVDGRGSTYGYTVLTGRVPGYLNPVRDFFIANLSRSGWTLGGGDAEGNEAEAFFSGHGGTGHFKVRTLPRCDGALSLRLTFAARKSPAP